MREMIRFTDGLFLLGPSDIVITDRGDLYSDEWSTG